MKEENKKLYITNSELDRSKYYCDDICVSSVAEEFARFQCSVLCPDAIANERPSCCRDTLDTRFPEESGTLKPNFKYRYPFCDQQTCRVYKVLHAAIHYNSLDRR